MTELAFPSVAWFRALGDEMVADADEHRHLGTIDLSMIWSCLDTPVGDVHVRLTFDGFSLVEATEVDDDFDPAAVDFVLEGDFDDWWRLIGHLVDTAGRPQRDMTLNYLSLPGTPLRCWSPDPLGRDAFFRFNQSLQTFVNAAGRLSSVPMEGAAV